MEGFCVLAIPEVCFVRSDLFTQSYWRILWFLSIIISIKTIIIILFTLIILGADTSLTAMWGRWWATPYALRNGGHFCWWWWSQGSIWSVNVFVKKVHWVGWDHLWREQQLYCWLANTKGDYQNHHHHHQQQQNIKRIRKDISNNWFPWRQSQSCTAC